MSPHNVLTRIATIAIAIAIAIAITITCLLLCYAEIRIYTLEGRGAHRCGAITTP